MLEVELKYRCGDWDRVRAALAAGGATPRGTHEEADHYFNAPDRDFAATDEAFRLRRVGDETHFTYKGPKRQAVAKSRTEIEVPLAAGAFADAERMLVSLGYRPVAVVRKRREVWVVRGLTVCLDEVEGVGRFVEVEAIAGEDEMDAAGAAVRALAEELHLGDVEPRAYLRMGLGS